MKTEIVARKTINPGERFNKNSKNLLCKVDISEDILYIANPSPLC